MLQMLALLALLARGGGDDGGRRSSRSGRSRRSRRSRRIRGIDRNQNIQPIATPVRISTRAKKRQAEEIESEDYNVESGNKSGYKSGNSYSEFELDDKDNNNNNRNNIELVIPSRSYQRISRLRFRLLGQ